MKKNLMNEEVIKAAPDDDRCVCGQIYEDENGDTCACEIIIPAPTAAECESRMTMVYPFAATHGGKHVGSKI